MDVLFSIWANTDDRAGNFASLLSARSYAAVDLTNSPFGRVGKFTVGWLRCPDVPDTVAVANGTGEFDIECRLIVNADGVDYRFKLDETRLRAVAERAPEMVDRALDPTIETPTDDIPTLPWVGLLHCIVDRTTGQPATLEAIETAEPTTEVGDGN